VKQADAVCSAYNARVPRTSAPPRSYAAVEAYVARTLPLYDAALHKLAVLQPPRQDAAAAATWLAADRRESRALRNLGLAARRRDFPGVTTAAAQAKAAAREAGRAARTLGLQVCGRSVASGR
jgi:hypothetical protein